MNNKHSDAVEMPCKRRGNTQNTACQPRTFAPLFYEVQLPGGVADRHVQAQRARPVVRQALVVGWAWLNEDAAPAPMGTRRFQGKRWHSSSARSQATAAPWVSIVLAPATLMHCTAWAMPLQQAQPWHHPAIASVHGLSGEFSFNFTADASAQEVL